MAKTPKDSVEQAIHEGRIEGLPDPDREILDEVAAGRLTPDEAARRIAEKHRKPPKD